MPGAGRVQEGIDEYQQALRLNPNYAEAYYNLGLALADAGQLELAIQNYRQALRLRPNNAEARNNLGNALFNTNQIRRRLSSIRRHWHFNRIARKLTTT